MLEPNGEHILIEVIERSEVLQRQIQAKIPGFQYAKGHTKESYPNIGIIYAIGNGCPKNLGYKIGDTVVFDVGEVGGFKWEGKSIFPANWKSPQALIKGEL